MTTILGSSWTKSITLVIIPAVVDRAASPERERTPRPRAVVHELAAGVVPVDEHEARNKGHHVAVGPVRGTAVSDRETSDPAPALCVYVVLLDDLRRTVLVVDHLKAGLWLFPGGHVDDGEDPRATVLLEAAEELGTDGVSTAHFGPDPLFLSVTKTRGEHSHRTSHSRSSWRPITTCRSTPILGKPTKSGGSRWMTRRSGRTTGSICTGRGFAPNS